MREIIIITEGPTEQEFISKILIPFFTEKGIYRVYPKTIKTSKDHYGGLLKYNKLKNDLGRHLSTKHGSIITTLIDYFHLPESMPNYATCQSKRTIDEKIDCLITGLASDIEEINENIFLPYIQKHEFEALLFSNISWGSAILNEKGCKRLSDIVEKYANPEDINEGNDTSPSNRLLKIFKDCSGERYNKVIFGELIASEIGINTIIKQCPRFSKWINTLVALAGS